MPHNSGRNRNEPYTNFQLVRCRACNAAFCKRTRWDGQTDEPPIYYDQRGQQKITCPICGAPISAYAVQQLHPHCQFGCAVCPAWQHVMEKR